MAQEFLMTTHLTRQSSVLQRVLGKIGLAALALATLLAGGCGGGGSVEPSTSTGDVSISLTDSPGDFAAYTVDVSSLQLVKQNGTQVSALPTTTRVDFTQYTDLSEFLTVASVPSGTYSQVVRISTTAMPMSRSRTVRASRIRQRWWTATESRSPP